MTDEAPETSNPTPQRPIRIGKVHTLRAARRALVRITEAVLAGRITTKVANSAIYGLTGVGRLLEVEVLESRLDALEAHQELAGRITEPTRYVGHA